MFLVKQSCAVTKSLGSLYISIPLWLTTKTTARKKPLQRAWRVYSEQGVLSLLAGRMAPRNTNDVVWVGGENEDGHWLCSGGQLEQPVKVTFEELREQFPIFHAAVLKLCESIADNLVTAEDLETLFGLAGLALTEIIPRRQRYQMYRAVACFLGYKDRTQLPPELETAIRDQWSEPGENFVGFQPAA